MLRQMGLIPAPARPAAKEGRGISTAAPNRKEAKPTPKPKPQRPVAPRAKPVAANTSTKPKRLLVTLDESDLWDALAKTLGRRVGTTVQFSQVTRAMWTLLLDAEDAIDRVPAPPLKRPGNARPEDFAEFEAELAGYLHDLIRAIKPGDR